MFKLTDFNAKTQDQIRAQLRDDSRSVEADKSQQASAQALDGCLAKHQGRAGRVVVSFVALLKRTLDDDNLVASIKPLRDAVAATLGIDDGDKRIIWQYGQQHTQGRETVLVHIETI